MNGSSGWLDAAAPLFATAFLFQGASVTWLEILAFGLAILMVVCNIRVNILGWPLAALRPHRTLASPVLCR